MCLHLSMAALNISTEVVTPMALTSAFFMMPWHIIASHSIVASVGPPQGLTQCAVS